MKIVTTKLSKYVLPKHLGGCPGGHWVLVDSQNDNRAEDFDFQIIPQGYGGRLNHGCWDAATQETLLQTRRHHVSTGPFFSQRRSRDSKYGCRCKKKRGTSPIIPELQGGLGFLKWFLVLLQYQQLIPPQESRRSVPCDELRLRFLRRNHLVGEQLRWSQWIHKPRARCRTLDTWRHLHPMSRRWALDSMRAHWQRQRLDVLLPLELLVRRRQEGGRILVFPIVQMAHK